MTDGFVLPLQAPEFGFQVARPLLGGQTGPVFSVPLPEGGQAFRIRFVEGS
jgi:hypothetical protein